MYRIIIIIIIIVVVVVVLKPNKNVGCVKN